MCGRKRELGLSGREVFVPQRYELGQEAQVDWFEGMAVLGGEMRKLHFFAMRSMGSGDAFRRAYPHATQQALLEAHEHAFAYFGGVFKTLRYDNMTSVVKKILRGYQRVETDRIIAFRSHWATRASGASWHSLLGNPTEWVWRRSEGWGAVTCFPPSFLHVLFLPRVQESVVFVNNGALKSTLAPAQRIAGIISWWRKTLCGWRQ